MGLLITFVLGLFILIGVFLVKISKNTKLIENLSISVALGCMISLAVSDLFPEIYEIYDETCFRKLNDSDITAICKSYVNKVREIGGEFIDAVKKVS